MRACLLLSCPRMTSPVGEVRNLGADLAQRTLSLGDKATVSSVFALSVLSQWPVPPEEPAHTYSTVSNTTVWMEETGSHLLWDLTGHTSIVLGPLEKGLGPVSLCLLMWLLRDT